MDPSSVITAISALVRKHKSDALTDGNSGQSIDVVSIEVDLRDKAFNVLFRILPRSPNESTLIRSSFVLLLVVLKSTCGASTLKIAIKSNSISISVTPISFPFGTSEKNVMLSIN